MRGSSPDESKHWYSRVPPIAWLPSFVGLRNGTKLRRGYSFSVNQFSQNGFFSQWHLVVCYHHSVTDPNLKPIFTPQPSGLEGYCRHGPGGRAGGLAGGCQTCWTHISVTAWRIFSIRSFVELAWPLVVHCHGHWPICPIWACPCAKNLSNLPQIGSRLCGSHISETAGWMYPI